MSRILLVAGVVAGSTFAAPLPALAGDYDTLTVAESVRLDDMPAGGQDTAALLSPDGTHLLHFGETLTCLYDVAGNALAEVRCGGFPETVRLPADMYWSPDSTLMVWPSFADAFVYYDDTDIGVATPTRMRLKTLTDDRYERTVISEGPAEFDVAGQWLDANTIVFARYSVTAEGINSLYAAPSPSLMTITLDGNLATLFGPVATKGGLITSIDVTADGGRIAFLLDDPADASISGVHLFDIGSAAPRRIVARDQFNLVALPKVLGFSADGKYLALQGQMTSGLSVTIVDVETGVLTPFSLGDRDILGVAWSPTGSALAYIVSNGLMDDEGNMPDGLYLSEPPGTAGRLLLEGPFAAPTCCGVYPIVWGANDTMVLGNNESLRHPFLMRFER